VAGSSTLLGLDPADADAVARSSFPAGRVERHAAELRAAIGGREPLEPWPPVEPLFYPHVFLAALPDVRAFHAERGIPDDVSWATLADLGRVMRIHRGATGEPGLDEQNWLRLHWRGLLFELGRLQFDRAKADALGVHIPVGGPLEPAAVDDALARARPFFDRHFPEDGYRTAVCTSWLLDPQLAEVLPADSNIVRFQQRFELLDEGAYEGDEDVFKFVFRRVDPPLDELPRRTTLERALVAHLRAGGHWQVRKGRVELP
jgi:hypothetical protein